MSERPTPAGPGDAGGPIARTRLRLPIRVKLATVSGALTFAILLLFAVVVGAFTEQKLRSSFDSQLRATADRLQAQFQARGFRLRLDPDTGELRRSVDPELFEVAQASGAVLRVWDRERGDQYALDGAPFLGRLYEDVRDYGGYRVIARPLFGTIELDPEIGAAPGPLDGAGAAIQYGEPTDDLLATINRVRLFLALGVLGGTLLAFVAGFVVARRAMRPISDLTQAAREVARTRDPAHTTLPRPAANDEVAELSKTLSEMLVALDAARTETESALERQRQFVADASHELRTPLTSILANLELLGEELARPDGPRDRELVSDSASSALRSSVRMRRLVGDLLLLARADAGRRPATEPVDMAAVVREAVREAEAVGTGHPVTIDLPPMLDGLAVQGAPDDLHRLVLNLVENALLHTPSGTPVVVSLRRDGDRVALAVADRGPGVPAAQRERIFERFARSAGDRSTVGGSGLGLAIVRAVAEAHGGAVAVRDAQGGGALFEITLPTALRSAHVRVDGREQAPEPKGVEQP
jgi:signal transduction histidine kinase